MLKHITFIVCDAMEFQPLSCRQYDFLSFVSFETYLTGKSQDDAF